MRKTNLENTARYTERTLDRDAQTMYYYAHDNPLPPYDSRLVSHSVILTLQFLKSTAMHRYPHLASRTLF